MRNLLLGAALAVTLGLGSAWYAWQQGAAAVAAVRADLPKIDAAGSYRPKLKTRVLAADGTLLAVLYRENREPVPLEAMPAALVQATIASEDRRFYQHAGLSPRDIARAALANLRRRQITQGASTITQQLARDLYLSDERTWQRKLREALLAVELERRYSKEELLELYLNQINYGKGAYGCRTAARMYFGCEPKDLTLAQCAALAAIPRRPTAYNLYDDPQGALKRRDGVLGLMVEQGFATSAQGATAQRERLRVKAYAQPDWTPLHAPYFTSLALRELVERVGEERAYTGGLTVKTTVDLRLQEAADRAVRQAVRRAADRGASEGAALLLEVRTGRILALTGGLDWSASQFNRATQARRQPGSAFKPIVYAAALDQGFRPTDALVDEPLTIKIGPNDTWKPRNYDERWHGKVTLTEALAQSYNIPAVLLGQKLGPPLVISYAQRLGITSLLRPVPSLALGASEVTLLELTSAFSAFPGQGARAVPTTLVEVLDPDGRPVWRHQPVIQSCLDPAVAGQMVGMLSEAMRTGTGKPAAFDGPHGGKTGTTSDNRDAWFVGFTPDFAAGVWLGDDRNRAMRGVFGGAVCGPAWRTLVQGTIQALGGAPAFSVAGQPAAAAVAGKVSITGEALAKVRLCDDTGLLAGDHCPRVVTQALPAAQVPRARCQLHVAQPEPEPKAPPVKEPSPKPPPPAEKADEPKVEVDVKGEE